MFMRRLSSPGMRPVAEESPRASLNRSSPKAMSAPPPGKSGQPTHTFSVEQACTGSPIPAAQSIVFVRFFVTLYSCAYAANYCRTYLTLVTGAPRVGACMHFTFLPSGQCLLLFKLPSCHNKAALPSFIHRSEAISTVNWEFVRGVGSLKRGDSHRQAWCKCSYSLEGPRYCIPDSQHSGTFCVAASACCPLHQYVLHCSRNRPSHRYNSIYKVPQRFQKMAVAEPDGMSYSNPHASLMVSHACCQSHGCLRECWRLCRRQ